MTGHTSGIFKALADDRRRSMLLLLGQAQHTVEQLRAKLGISQSSTSQHLKLLLQSGLVSFRKHGNFRVYELRQEELKNAMSFFDGLWDDGLQSMKHQLEAKHEKRTKKGNLD